MSVDNNKVAYITSPLLIKAVDQISIVKHRGSMVNSLIEALDYMKKMTVIQPQSGSKEDLRDFHSEDYVDFLQSSHKMVENVEEEDNFGLGFDCPIFKELWDVTLAIAGASLKAAEVLVNEDAKLAINWCGGWHHAQRDGASGFCYINDVVLSIQRLRSKFDKVLYIDLDVHHGDGVENAFLFSRKVLTLSLHQQEAGFFPGTGKTTDNGLGRGKHYSINIPYRSGINDKQFVYVFENIIYDVFSAFNPDAIVCQCGADALSGDPLASANLTIEGYRECVRHVLQLKKPTLFLGGGGYNKINTAKLWAGLTSLIIGEKMPEEVPEHSFFPMYGPDFTLEVCKSLRKSENTAESLDETIISTLKSLILLDSKNNELKEDFKNRIQFLENERKI